MVKRNLIVIVVLVALVILLMLTFEGCRDTTFWCDTCSKWVKNETANYVTVDTVDLTVCDDCYKQLSQDPRYK